MMITKWWQPSYHNNWKMLSEWILIEAVHKETELFEPTKLIMLPVLICARYNCGERFLAPNLYCNPDSIMDQIHPLHQIQVLTKSTTSFHTQTIFDLDTGFDHSTLIWLTQMFNHNARFSQCQPASAILSNWPKHRCNRFDHSTRFKPLAFLLPFTDLIARLITQPCALHRTGHASPSNGDRQQQAGSTPDMAWRPTKLSRRPTFCDYVDPPDCTHRPVHSRLRRPLWDDRGHHVHTACKSALR